MQSCTSLWPPAMSSWCSLFAPRKPRPALMLNGIEDQRRARFSYCEKTIEIEVFLEWTDYGYCTLLRPMNFAFSPLLEVGKTSRWSLRVEFVALWGRYIVSPVCSAWSSKEAVKFGSMQCAQHCQRLKLAAFISDFTLLACRGFLNKHTDNPSPRDHPRDESSAHLPMNK